MLTAIYFKSNDEYMYYTDYEAKEVVEALDYLGAEYEIYMINERMYRITWYYDLNEEWVDIWCTEDDYEEQMKLIKEAKVEFTVEQFN